MSAALKAPPVAMYPDPDRHWDRYLVIAVTQGADGTVRVRHYRKLTEAEAVALMEELS